MKTKPIRRWLVALALPLSLVACAADATPPDEVEQEPQAQTNEQHTEEAKEAFGVNPIGPATCPPLYQRVCVAAAPPACFCVPLKVNPNP